MSMYIHLSMRILRVFMYIVCIFCKNKLYTCIYICTVITGPRSASKADILYIVMYKYTNKLCICCNINVK